MDAIVITDYYFVKVKNIIMCNKEFVEHTLNKIVQKNNIDWNQLNKNDDIIKLIEDYIIHKHNRYNNQEGGSKNDPKYIVPKQIKLPDIKSIKKICSFKIKKKVVVGEYDYSILKLKSGTYDAYLVDDNLMIINATSKVKPTKSITNWEWTHSGKQVNVEGGTFGFFDLNTLQQINKIIKPKLKNSIPHINRNFSYTPEDGMQFGYTSVSGQHIEDLSGDDKKKFKTFGVSSSTQIGDGGFECYIIGDDRAILIGGYTGDKLFWKSNI